MNEFWNWIGQAPPRDPRATRFWFWIFLMLLCAHGGAIALFYHLTVFEDLVGLLMLSLASFAGLMAWLDLFL